MSGRFVVLGAAHWHAPWHRDALERAGGRVVAASDLDPARAVRLLAGRPGGAFADWREMLDAHPDAVPMILLPPDDAAAALTECRWNGRAVMIEKPGTRSADDLNEVLRIPSRAPESVPFINRYASFWQALAAVGSPERVAGEWVSAHFRILAGPPDRYLRDGVPWVLDPDRFGGGALRNLGIHAADAIAQLADLDRLTIRSARVSNRQHGLAVEDFAIAMLETDDGRVLTLEAGYTMPSERTPDKEWRIVGDRWAVAESNGVLSVRSPAGIVSSDAISSAEQYLRYGKDLAGIGRGSRQPADLRDLAMAQRLVDRIYEAAT